MKKIMKKMIAIVLTCFSLVGAIMFTPKVTSYASTEESNAVLDFGEKTWITYYAGLNENMTGGTATPQGLKNGTELVYLSSVVNKKGVEIAYCYVPSANVYCYITSRYVKVMEEKPVIADGIYTIHTKLDENKVWDVEAWNANNCANLQLWEYTGADNQLFQVSHVSDDCYIIESVYSGKLVDVAGGNVFNTNNVQLYETNGTTSQKFIIKEAGEKFFTIASALNEAYVLDCAWGNADNGTNIFLYNVNSSAAQLFAFEPVEENYVYAGVEYDVVDGLSEEYWFDQRDYNRFLDSNGKNVGCTATALATAYSTYNKTLLSPNSNSIRWTNGVGVTWAPYTYLTGYYSNNLTAVYDYLEENVPVIIRLRKSSTRGHSVTVVGVAEGADRANLSMKDFLVIDPWGGTVKTLSQAATGYMLDSSWRLIVPVKK